MLTSDLQAWFTFYIFAPRACLLWLDQRWFFCHAQQYIYIFKLETVTDFADQRMRYDILLTVWLLKTTKTKICLMADSRVFVAFGHLWFGGLHDCISNQWHIQVYGCSLCSVDPTLLLPTVSLFPSLKPDHAEKMNTCCSINDRQIN